MKKLLRNILLLSTFSLISISGFIRRDLDVHAENTKEVVEDFEAYTIEGSGKELGDKWTNSWFKEIGDFDSIACDDSHFKVVVDPENKDNKCLFIDTATSNESFFFLTLKDVYTKNFELSYRYYHDHTGESPWFGINCRKPDDGRYNGVTNVMLTHRAWGADNLGFQSYRSVNDSFTPVDTKYEDENGIGVSYGNIDDAPVNHNWINVKVVVQDSDFSMYINDTLLGHSEITKKSAQNPGYVSFVSCVNKCYIDDVHFVNKDEVEYTPGGGNDNPDTQATAPTITNNEITFEDQDADLVIPVSLYGEVITELKQGNNVLLTKDYYVENDNLVIDASKVKELMNGAERKMFILTTAGGSVSFFVNMPKEETPSDQSDDKTSEKQSDAETSTPVASNPATSETTEPEKKKGCGGALATSGIISLLAVAFALMLKRKQK